jgi:putative CocE/NonD family hydrolase
VPTSFYFHSGGGANTLDGNGSLSETRPSGEPADRFVYDPWNPVPTGQRGGYSRIPTDQRELERRQDVLVYTTGPFPSPIEVTGPIEVRLWASSSATDTDFTAKLVDVFPDGTARMLTDGILRARYRRSKTAPVLLTPGQAEDMTIDVGATSNLFTAGHRLRIEISSSNFPRFDRNPNTGTRFAESAELRRAEQTVFHDAQRPSRLVLPIVSR